MLSDRLQSDLSTVTTSLKKDISALMTDAAAGFLNECQAVATRFDLLSRPGEAEVYQAALLYLKGEIGEDIEYLFDLVAFGLYTPIESLDNRCVAYDHRKLEVLLNRYRDEARRGRLWEMTWFGVLEAYYRPHIRFSEQNILLGFLKDTYADIIAHIGHEPVWLTAIKNNPGMLTREPGSSFAEDWLEGRRETLTQVARDLQIPDDSWFWQDLTRTCIRHVTDMPDDDFKARIPQLLGLIRERPGFLDEDLNSILYRYYQCQDRSAHAELRDFACHHWKNPKLRHAPESKWIHARLPVWQMVLEWVNDEHLRVFFEKISARYGASRTRLSSWMRYLSWTKFVAGYENDLSRQKDPEILRIFEAEETALAASGDLGGQKLDAFLQVIGDYLVRCSVRAG